MDKKEKIFREILWNDEVEKLSQKIGNVAQGFDYPVVRQRGEDYEVVSIIELALRHTARAILSGDIHRARWEAYSDFYNDVRGNADERGMNFSESMQEDINAIGEYMEGTGVSFHYPKRGQVYNRKLVVICAMCYTADTLES